jgi:hypothetical protein
MRRTTSTLAALALAAALPSVGATAQLEGLLNKGDRTNGLTGLAGIASAPMTSGSVGNVAGLLQYCIKNNYLGGDDVTSIKDQLVGKLPGGTQTQDPGYGDGVKGLLRGSNGNVMDLGGGGLKADLTRKACDTILAQAKSFF